MDEDDESKRLDAAAAVKEGGCPECEIKPYDTIYREFDGNVTTEVMNSMKNNGWEPMLKHSGMIKFCEKCMQP